MNQLINTVSLYNTYDIFFDDIVGLNETFLIQSNISLNNDILQYGHIFSYKYNDKKQIFKFNFEMYTSMIFDSEIYISKKELYQYLLLIMHTPDQSRISSKDIMNNYGSYITKYMKNMYDREDNNFNISVGLLKLLNEKFKMDVNKLIKAHSYYETNINSNLENNIYNYLMNMKDHTNHVIVIRFGEKKQFIGKFIFAK